MWVDNRICGRLVGVVWGDGYMDMRAGISLVDGLMASFKPAQ